MLIAEALNEQGMWNEEDRFFYDTLSISGSAPLQLRIHSIVGITTLFAVSIIEKKKLDKLADFQKRINWFENYRLKNNKFWPNEEKTDGESILLSLIPRSRLVSLLERLLNEEEFLSPGGIRACRNTMKKILIRYASIILTIPSNMIRAIPPPIYSAEIPIGADRYGCRSITSSSSPSENTENFMAMH